MMATDPQLRYITGLVAKSPEKANNWDRKFKLALKVLRSEIESKMYWLKAWTLESDRFRPNCNIY